MKIEHNISPLSNDVRSFQRLETSRLNLTLVNIDAADDILKNIDQEIVQNIGGRVPWPYSQQDAIYFIEGCRKAQSKRLRYDYIIRDKITQSFIGIIALHIAKYEDCEKPGEIGYWITKTQRYQGYAFEAVEAIIDVAKVLGFNSVWASCRHDNLPSIRLLEKVGMKLIGKDIGIYLEAEVEQYIYEKEIFKLLILITGASGSGKTATLKSIEQKLDPSLISINYFDNIGVPTFDGMVAKYGSAEKWQEVTTHTWIERLAKITDKKFIFLEGSFNPEFAVSRMQELEIKSYLIICIHADRKVREERLIQSRKQLELVTQDMENFAQVLKDKTSDLGGIIIESSENSLSIVAQEIIDLIFKHIEVKAS